MSAIELPALAASVVMPTYGRRESLLRVLEALDHQQVPGRGFEVIVVCDGDVDGSDGACMALAPRLHYPLRVLVQENQGPAAARNRGVEEARAELIVFLDDDVVPEEGLLAAHCSAHAGETPCVSIGPLLPPTDERLTIWSAWETQKLCQQYDAMALGHYQPTWRQFFTGNAAVGKQSILDAGGFDPTFRRAEDVELGLRLHEMGLRFVFLPQARSCHYIRRSFSAWCRMPRAYGAADVAMARAGHPSILATAIHEYRCRQWPVRVAVWLGAGRPVASVIVRAVLAGVVRVAEACRSVRSGSPACSILFNLLYAEGLMRAVGGRDMFHSLLHGQDVMHVIDPAGKST